MPAAGDAVVKPAMFSFGKTQNSYDIYVGKKNLLTIIRKDSAALFNSQCLVNRLDTLKGVSRVEYDGHFGPYVFVTIDVEDDNRATHAAIKKIIKEHIS